MSRVKLGTSLALIASGIGFFAASVVLMNNYKVLSSILSAILGFTTLSLGIDMLKTVK